MKDISFNISARTAKLIGQENFANAEGAIIELVKNCYDADATTCIVLFKNGSLYIIDDGDGMTEDIIENHWMTIGTAYKNNNEPTAAKARIKTGAKGIGRFALDRLGAECEMLTQAELATPIQWNVDWKLFDGLNAKLTDVKARIQPIKTINFKSNIKKLIDFSELPDDFFKRHFLDNTGTIIRISELRDKWQEEEINQAFQNIEQLIPPLENKSFTIYIYSQEHRDHFGIVDPEPFSDYDYKLTSNISKNGKVSITIWRNELDPADLEKRGFFERSELRGEQYNISAFKNKHFTIKTTLNDLITIPKNGNNSNNLDKIGAFDFSFFFMKRGGVSDKEDDDRKYPYRAVNYSKRSDLLSRYGGIKIFRDNFRVRPYGEAKSISFDWLDLGNRAARSPTITGIGYKVRPTQVYGVVNISKVKNPVFQDKSNREGLQENDVFSLFKEILIAIINKFESDRSSILAELDRIHRIDNKEREAIENTPNAINNYKKKYNINPSNPRNNTPASPPAPPHQTEEKQAEADQIINQSEIAIEALKQEVTELRTEIQLYRLLASTGLTVASFSHELKNIRGKLKSRADYLKSTLASILKSHDMSSVPEYENPLILIDNIKKEDSRITHWLDFSLSSLRRDKRTRTKINILDYAYELQKAWSISLNEKKIKLTVKNSGLQNSLFRGFEIDLDTIFNNLITNSIEAFTRPGPIMIREIALTFPFSPDGIVIVYEDSGPGLAPEINNIDQIFEPFFTTKRNSRTGEVTGYGLGMWLVKATIKEYNGTIEVSPKRPGFKVTIHLQMTVNL